VRRTEHFDEFGGLGAGGEHAGVRGGVVGFVEEGEVRVFDSCRGVEVDVRDEVVGVGLLPVAGLAAGA
jgi:hypothetical protein